MKQLLAILVFTLQPVWSSGQQLSFENFMDHLNDLEMNEDFTGALDYLLNFKNEFPGKWFAISKEQIHINEKRGAWEDNLEVFREGHRRGFFFFLHSAIPRYMPYLEFPEFETLVQADRQLHEKALEHSSTLYQVDLPPGFNPDRRYPLFMIFHGGNSNFQRVRNHWNDDSLDHCFIKIYMQSYRHFDSESFTWRSGDPRSDTDILRIYQEILIAYPVDTACILVSGMSAGATYATGMALRGVIPVSGILAFCPGLPREISSGASFMPPPGIRGYFLGGEKDFYREQQVTLAGILERMGLEYTCRVVDGMSHQYPNDESKYIREGLGFIH